MRLNPCLLLPLLGASLVAADNSIIVPTLSDDRLQISLYAADPDIMTPIGGAVDSKGRLFVIECHTHTPPADYDGPKGDVIKVFEGTRPDGRYEKMSIFADDLFQAQALGFDRDGNLYVVCTRGVFILHDRDNDGRSESRTRIMHIDPYERRGNPHGQGQAIAFSADNQWIYVGNMTNDDWVGSDGSRFGGGYYGSSIVRAHLDGTNVEPYAWGVRNPFGINFDRFGRLLVIDNDPDHRGPNRLMHVVKGGDYGHKSTYGGTGTHPYASWNGEVPGTLPFLHGIGESPTSVIDANATGLPLDYRDTIIGATWAEHELTLFRTSPAGATLKATKSALVKGVGDDNLTSPFRPSGIAASPDGSIYVSDWMLVDYTTHKRGRIWKITTKPGVATMTPRNPFTPYDAPTGEYARMLSLAEASNIEEYSSLQRALTSADPYIRSAAFTAMARPVFRDSVIRDLENSDPRIRLGALLALRRAGVEDASLIGPRLADSDVSVSRMAMQWAGEKQLIGLADQVDAAASKPNLNADFFQTWLATMQILQTPPPAPAPAPGAGGRGGRGGNPAIRPNVSFLEKLVHDEQRPLVLRSMVIRMMPGVEKPFNHELLVRLARKSDPMLQVEAVRRLGTSSFGAATTTLREIALDRSQPDNIRIEAVAAMAGNPDNSLVALLDDPNADIRLEAARSLRALSADAGIIAAARRKLAAIQGNLREARLANQLEFLVDPEKVVRPQTLDGWQKLLAAGGDPEAGRRAFFSANNACVACHIAEGRGARLGGGGEGAGVVGFVALPTGPDLTVIGASVNRQSIIRSIINPSDEIQPEFQGWFVKMKNGEMSTGRQIDQESRAIQLVLLDGYEHDFPREDIESWGALPQSLMPEGLAQGMAVEEFRDLVAYLESLR